MLYKLFALVGLLAMARGQDTTQASLNCTAAGTTPWTNKMSESVINYVLYDFNGLALPFAFDKCSGASLISDFQMFTCNGDGTVTRDKYSSATCSGDPDETDTWGAERVNNMTGLYSFECDGDDDYVHVEIAANIAGGCDGLQVPVYAAVSSCAFNTLEINAVCNAEYARLQYFLPVDLMCSDMYFCSFETIGTTCGKWFSTDVEGIGPVDIYGTMIECNAWYWVDPTESTEADDSSVVHALSTMAVAATALFYTLF